MAPDAEGRRKATHIAIDLALYAISALISFALLNNVLKKLDPNEGNAKQARRAAPRRASPPPGSPPSLQAVEKKKEIAARLGRPLLNTNQYEDVRPAAAAAVCAGGFAALLLTPLRPRARSSSPATSLTLPTSTSRSTRLAGWTT